MSHKQGFKEYLTGRVSVKTRDKEYIFHFERLMAHYTTGGENPDTKQMEEAFLPKHPYDMTPQEFLQIYSTIYGKIQQENKYLEENRKGSTGHASSRAAVNHYKDFMESLLDEEAGNNFEWVELYQAIADKLLFEYENNRDALFVRIRQEGKKNDIVKTRLDDFDETRKAAGEARVTHLDPFTLMGTCNYSGKEGAREKRNEVVLFWVELLELDKSQDLSDDTKKIIEKLQNGDHPLHLRGVPTAQRNPIFANTKGHIEDDIERLWQLLASATQWADGKGNENDFMSAFDKAIEINDFALMKGTSPLFWARPNFFLSLDEPSREYIKIQMQKDDDFFEGFDAIKRGQGAGRGKRYLEIREEVKKNIHSNFLQLSYEAYEEKNAKESYPKLHQASLKSIELDDTRTDEEKKEVKRELRKIRDSKKPYTTKKAIVESRVGQGNFRNELLEYWHGSCAVTAFNNKKLLRASHIQPWSKSNDQERVDRDNGLLLSPDLDLAFDRGFITFRDDGTIETSDDFTNYDKLGIHDTMRIDASKLTDKHKHYLEYHRKNIFKK